MTATLGLCLIASFIFGGIFLEAQTSRPLRVSEQLDYLVEDVCVDGSDQATVGDPATCKSHRNVQIGEPLPYILTDFDRTRGRSYQSVSSIPVRGTDGQLKVMMVKILQGAFTGDFRFHFSANRDGFDLVDISHSTYASIVRTYDPGCYDQLFSRNGRTGNLADRSGGWVLFPLRPPTIHWAQTTSLHLATWRVQLSPGGLRCASNHSTGVTVWYRPTPFRFISGKKLMTLRSDHFAAENLSQSENSFERFYFTREYGLTRWEAWTTLAFCQSSPGIASGRCAGRSDSAVAALCDRNSNLEEHGGQKWVRGDCRDFTRYVPLARAQLPLSPAMGNGDGVMDVDYEATVHKR